MIYHLTFIETVEYEYDYTSNFFAFSESEVLDEKDRRLKKVTKANGEYISNVTCVNWNIEKITFNEFKELATVAEYEELFDVIVENPMEEE